MFLIPVKGFDGRAVVWMVTKVHGVNAPRLYQKIFPSSVDHIETLFFKSPEDFGYLDVICKTKYKQMDLQASHIIFVATFIIVYFF